MASDAHWHLRKEISVGHIITTTVILATVFTWAWRMDARVGLIEQDMVNHKSVKAHGQVAERLREIEKNAAVGANQIRINSQALVRIELKIDQLAARFSDQGQESR